MVKIGGHPRRGGVASLALLREPRLNVVRIRRAVVIGSVAPIAIRGRACELPIDVASRAGQCGMRAGQSEAGEFQVIEFCVEPRIRAVAAFACGGKIERLMIWVECLLKIRIVAGNAGGLKTHVLADGFSFVAINAIHHGVSTQQRKSIGVFF